MSVSTEEIEKLVSENEKLIHWCLRPYRNFKNSRYDYEDLLQVATLEFINALEKYDESKGTLSTYMAIRIPAAVHRFIIKNSSYFTLSTKQDPKEVDTSKEISLSSEPKNEGRGFYETVGGHDDGMYLAELLSDVEDQCYSGLLDGTELFSQWKLWRFGGYTHKEIGDRYGLSPSAVSMRLRGIEKKLKTMEGHYGF